MSTVTDADTLRKLADWFDARDAVHGVSSSEVQRDLRRIADILDHNEDVKYLCDLQAENGEFRHMLDILNDALLEERLSNVGKVHPCDDQTAGHLASVEAEIDRLRAELDAAAEATGIAGVDRPMSLLECIQSLRARIAELEQRLAAGKRRVDLLTGKRVSNE